MKKNDNLIRLDDFIDMEYGHQGTPKREKFEQGFEEFKLGALIHEARKAKGLTQTQLADNAEQPKPIYPKWKMM